MKTIIAGSRDISDYAFIEEAIVESGFEVSLVLSGCARGVDQLAAKWAEKNRMSPMGFSVSKILSCLSCISLQIKRF